MNQEPPTLKPANTANDLVISVTKIQPLPPAFLFEVSDIPTLWSLNTIQHSTSQPTFYAE